jgi:hypothetical protein
MLAPLLAAAQAVYTRPGKTLVLGLQGEMGGTVFYAPASYLKIAETIRKEYKGPAKLELALMFNHAYLPGVINRAPDPPALRSLPASKTQALQGWGPLLPFAQWPEHDRLARQLPDLLRLLNAVDVLGVSCYPRTSADPQPAELESCAVKYDAELKAMGFDLRKWAAQPGKRFIWSEFGLGGGLSRCDDVPARTRAEAGRFSWLGVGWPWTAARDPWSKPELVSAAGVTRAWDLERAGSTDVCTRRDPPRHRWPARCRHAGMLPRLCSTAPCLHICADPPPQTTLVRTAPPCQRDFRRSWHDAALALFKAGGHAYRIDGAYMWNLCSMDPQAGSEAVGRVLVSLMCVCTCARACAPVFAVCVCLWVLLTGCEQMDGEAAQRGQHGEGG